MMSNNCPQALHQCRLRLAELEELIAASSGDLEALAKAEEREMGLYAGTIVEDEEEKEEEEPAVQAKEEEPAVQAKKTKKTKKSKGDLMDLDGEAPQDGDDGAAGSSRVSHSIWVCHRS